MTARATPARPVARHSLGAAVLADLRHCPDCADERLFTAVPCGDGHEDCPERVCVDCGTALLLAAA